MHGRWVAECVVIVSVWITRSLNECLSFRNQFEGLIAHARTLICSRPTLTALSKHIAHRQRLDQAGPARHWHHLGTWLDHSGSIGQFQTWVRTLAGGRRRERRRPSEGRSGQTGKTMKQRGALPSQEGRQDLGGCRHRAREKLQVDTCRLTSEPRAV